MKISIFLFLILFAIGCNPSSESEDHAVVKSSDPRLDLCIAAHGGKLYDHAHMSFDFRDRSYTFQHQDGTFRYTSKFSKDGQQYYDVLSNEGFEREIDEKPVALADSNIIKYSNSLNSVIYFALLPHKLLDPAAQIKYLGQVEILEQTYYTISVTFVEEGGGKDYDDNFYYWINSENNYLDYLAYDYQVDGGGVRFRKAYNPRVVDGIRFQDYINYKAPIGTKLEDLPTMLENGTLAELSRIELKNVKVM